MQALGRWIAVSSLVVAALSARADDFEATCHARVAPGLVEVDVDAQRIDIDRSLSVAQLTARERVGGAYRTLGLTQVHEEATIALHWSVLVHPTTGRACLRPQLKVIVHVNPQRVYLARELGNDGCPVRAVLAHEMRHVEINQAAAYAGAEHVAQALRAAYGNRVFYGDSRAALERAFEDEMHARWTPMLRHALDAARTENAAIDTPAEYARVGQSCHGALRALLAH